MASIEEELERLRATPAELVSRDIAVIFRGRRPPASVQAVLADPRRGLDRMASVLEAWWTRALEPHWPRIRSLLDADLAHRARRLTEGGPAALFSDLHPGVTWREDRLELGISFHARMPLDGQGLLIVPSVFYWHAVAPIVAPPWQPTLFYPARGLELLWEPGAPAPDALAGVIGRSRADLLTALDAPRSTTGLARRLGLSAGAVSQHLAALRAAGLATATRRGREVLYLRTELAEQLQASATP